MIIHVNSLSAQAELKGFRIEPVWQHGVMVFDLVRVSDETIILEGVGTMDIERYLLEHSSQDALQQAWNALCAVPSYVEQQAAQFASEPIEDQPEPHTTASAWWLNNDSVW